MRTRYYYETTKAKKSNNKFRDSKKPKGIPCESAAIENYVTQTMVDLGNYLEAFRSTPKTLLSNISKKERVALKNLAERTDIVIKKPDKGSGITIQTRQEYILEGLRQLQSADYYGPSSLAAFNASIVELDQHLNIMWEMGDIPKETYAFLTPKGKTDIKVPHLYHIPKVHKELTEMGTWKSRPILSACASPGARVSSYIDWVLQPFVLNQFTYLKDTTDLILLLEELVVPKDAILVAADVTSMYTNISHTECHRILTEVLTEEGMTMPSVENFVKLVDIHIGNNIFFFDGKVYIQTFGIPMGQKCSPTVADFCLFWYEKKLLQENSRFVLFYRRFRDDVLIIWTGTLEDLLVFQRKLNSMNPRLQFTFIHSLLKVDFMDASIFKGPRFEATGILDVATYFKPTNTYQYLHQSSCHPNHMFQAIVKGELCRYRRNTNDHKTFLEQKWQLQKHLEKRGYSKAKFKKIANTIKFTDRGVVLAQAKNDRCKNTLNGRPVFVTAYDEFTADLGPILRRNWHIIEECEEVRRMFGGPPMLAYTRHKNLSETLIRAALPTDP